MSGRKQDRDPDTPLLEWVCGAIGLVLFLGVIGVTLMNGLQEGGPPAFRVEQTAVRTDAQGLHHVSFSVANTGDETAASVQVAVSLKRAGQVVETREVTIDLIPPHSRREAAAVFSADPAAFELVVEPLGYLEP